MSTQAEREMLDRLEELELAVREHSDVLAGNVRAALEESITPTRYRTGKAIPAEPEVGATPFDIPVVIPSGIIDETTLAGSIYATPSHSTHGASSTGTNPKIPRADHDHGDNVGPALLALALSYSGTQLTGVSRTDTPGGAISAAVISYAGAQVSSVVVTKYGKTITTIPTYVAGQITAIARTVV